MTFCVSFDIMYIESERVTIKGDGTEVSTGCAKTPFTTLCNNCPERTKGDKYGLSDQSKIGGGDTPTPPASDLRSSDTDVFD